MASIINASTTAGLVNTADTSGILQLQTANTTAVTVDASQNVTFVGVTTLQAGTAALPALTTSGDTNTGIFFPAADTIAFSTGGAERARIPAAGGVQAVTTISVGNATPSASGAGITFPAGQSASSDANTLDDYEEGTWTPALSDGYTRTYAYQTGVYRKIGKLVYVFAQIQGSTRSGSAAGLAAITLPFPANGMSPNMHPNALFHVYNITHTSLISGAPQWDSPTEFRIYETEANGSQSYLNPSGIGATFQMGWTFMFSTNS